jgi:hypothetical protein
MRYGYQVRFTPPRPIAVEEPERSLEQLFDEYVGTTASIEAGGVPGRAKVRKGCLDDFETGAFLETGSSNDRRSQSVMVPTRSISASSVRLMTLPWRSSRSHSRFARPRRSCANAIMSRGLRPTPIDQRGTSFSALCLASRPRRTATCSLSRKASFAMSTSRPSGCRRSISSVRYWQRRGCPRVVAADPGAHIWPLGLYGPHALHATDLGPKRACPVARRPEGRITRACHSEVTRTRAWPALVGRRAGQEQLAVCDRRAGGNDGQVYPPFTRALLRELATHDLVRDICGISGV